MAVKLETYDRNQFGSEVEARAAQIQVFEKDIASMRKRLARKSGWRAENLARWIAEAEDQLAKFKAEVL